MSVILDSSHVPGRIRIIPIPEWPGFYHWGIEGWERDVNGQPTVWHSPKGKAVGCTTYVEFARGQVSQIIWTPERHEQQVSVLSRIKSIQGLPWHLTAANCEQVVRWAVEGEARSRQLENVGLFAAACATIFLLVKAFGKA